MSIRRGLFLLVMGIAAVLLVTRWFEEVLLAVSLLSESRQSLIGDASHSLSYVVGEEDELVIDLPARHGPVKLITNAVCARSRAPRDGRDLYYGLRYRIVGGDGGLWRDREYWFRSRVTSRVRDTTGQVGDRLFFLQSQWVPCDGRVVLLDLSGTGSGGKQLRLRLEDAAPEVAHVLARVYYERKLSAAKTRFRWERMRGSERERAARRNVYPPALLTEQEKLRYSSHEWTALAPRGVVGRDYRVRVLYRRREMLETGPAVDPVPSGLRVRPGRRGSIPLPEGSNLVTLEVERRPDPYVPAPAAERPRAPVPLWLIWHGRRAREREEALVHLPGDRLTRRGWYDGGLLEIRAGAPVSVRAFIAPDRREITPDGAWLRVWLCRPGEAITWDVHHADGEATPLRLDVRTLGQAGTGSSRWKGRAAWTLLDGGGKGLDRGELDPPDGASLWDALAGDERAEVSDPARAYLLVPPEGRRLRVEARAAPVLVCAFDRIPGAPKEVRVPEDAYAYHRARSTGRGWFIVRPRGRRDLLRDGRGRALRLQYRPSRPDRDIARGEYEWIELRPDSERLERDILMRRELQWVEKRALGAIAYTRVVPGEERVVEVLDPHGEGRVEPRLVWMREGGEGPLRVELAGRLLFEAGDARCRGEVELPPVRPGQYVLRVTASPDTRVFLSHLAGGAGERWLRKKVVRVRGRRTVWRHTRTAATEETLVGRLWLATQDARRVGVCVRIRGPGKRGPGPHPGWTYTERHLDVRPGPWGRAVALRAEWDGLRGGRRFAVPLHADLPPGEYLIEVTLQEPRPAYIDLGRAVPGRPPGIRLGRD